jgi:glutathionylspermidine synthase
MERIPVNPRNNWQKEVEKLGFGFHTADVPYWDESAFYEFSMAEINEIEKATQELWEKCLEAVQYVIDSKLYSKFFIPEWVVPLIERSWNEDHPAIYGRFDFSVKDGIPKLLEFNADTPTSLFEAGIIQWFWLQDFDHTKDQFNSIHEKLIEYWQHLKPYLHKHPLHCSCIKGSLEDLTTTEYLRDCAIQAGLDTRLVYMEDIGWNNKKSCFCDMDDLEIKNIFKLYPWEWLINEQFGQYLKDNGNMFWIEPPWKMILSNKAILPILWQLFADCPYLLPAYFEKDTLTDYVKKPILSREGANVELISEGSTLEKTSGEYGEEGYIYQALCKLPETNGNYAVIGSWVIGGQAAGIGIRESFSMITNNTSRFIPHLINRF